MSGSNCCFLTCILVSHKTGKVAWYSYLFKNFPHFVVIHTVIGFSIVNETEVDVFFLNIYFLVFSITRWMLSIWFLVPLLFLNPACTSESSWFTYCWSLAWGIVSLILLAAKWEKLYYTLNIFLHCSSLELEWKLNFSSPVTMAEFSKFASILSAALY